jgi:hypothetical protein
VIVAVTVVDVVAVPVDDVILVVLVLDGRVTAARTMDVLGVVAFAGVGAGGGGHGV